MTGRGRAWQIDVAVPAEDQQALLLASWLTRYLFLSIVCLRKESLQAVLW